jgi:excisionase family DNA binding protein
LKQRGRQPIRRGTVSRRELREVIAATYHQVWWPSTAAARFDGDRLPVWDEANATYLDPETGEVLPTWDQALDAITGQDEPLHVARFGTRFDAQGVLAGAGDANRCIGYLTKYLTKQLGDCHELGTDAQARHAARLAEALRWEPCSSACANWLRYGIQPKNAKKGLRPGACKGKAHRREYLGYAGRRVLTSRKWSGKTLADHRADRKAWLTETLGLPATDPARYSWQLVEPGDQDHMPTGQRLLHVVADRMRWLQALDQARRRAQRTATGRSFGNREGSMSEPSMTVVSQDDELLTVQQVAAWLKVEPPYVYRLASSGCLLRVYVGRYVRIPAASVRAYIKANTVEAVSQPPLRSARRPGARPRRRLRRAG